MRKEIQLIKIHSDIREIASIFTSNGKQIYLVGGAVRDMLMGKKIHDFDLATDALPEEVMAIVRKAGGKVIPTGIKHGTVTVIYKNQNAEVTTFRTESDYTDGRRPDKIEYARTIEEDLSRRDFTMNAIALRLSKEEIVDPFGGKKDIKAKTIRAVGSAAERFNEDGLRPLRAVRFASQLNFKIEQKTLDAINGALGVSAKVSWERVRDEFDKILMSALPSRGILLMEKTGLLSLFIEELAVCRGVEQNGYHRFDVLDHCLYTCDFAAEKEYPLELRLSSLFHDIGKPSVRNFDRGVYTFYRHEEVSAQMTRKILSRLRYSNAVTDKVCHLIKEHMFQYTDNWSDAAVRRFVARVGADNLDELYRLRRADTSALAGKESDGRLLMDLRDRVEKVMAKGRAFKIKDLAVTGTDLMAIGIPAGKSIGVILKELLETVLDDPAQNTKEKLLEIAKNLLKKINPA